MRSKLWLLLATAVCAATALFASAQPWVTVELAEGAAAFSELSFTGQQLHPAVSPVAIAVFAAVLALTIAGRVFRRVLGVLIAGLGFALSASAFGIFSDPTVAALSRLAEATGISGDAQGDMITGVTSSPMIMVTIIAGVCVGVVGLLITVMSGAWKSAGRKYDAGTRAQRLVSDEPDRISDWESQNDGVDPSDEEAPSSLDFPDPPASDSTSSDRTQ